MQIQFTIGDVSEDGHSKSENFVIDSNYPVETLQQAYIKSCAKIGFQFDDGYHSEFGGRDDNIKLLTNYEENNLPPEFFGVMKSFKYNLDALVDFDDPRESRKWPQVVYPNEVMYILIWVIAISMPANWIFSRETPPKLPQFNTNAIGYGVFE